MGELHTPGPIAAQGNASCAKRCAPLWDAHNTCLSDDCRFALAKGLPTARMCPMGFTTYKGASSPMRQRTRLAAHSIRHVCALFSHVPSKAVATTPGVGGHRMIRHGALQNDHM